MRFIGGRGRILRLRPGQLANFSGGAGYMPFIVMFSVPASILFGVAGSPFLHLRGKRVLARAEGPGAGLHEFVRFACWHGLVSLLLAVAAGAILFVFGQSMVYGDRVRYALVTLVFAAGPLAAWLLSSLVLVLLMVRRGARWTNLLLAAVALAVLLAACVPLLMAVSALTGVRI